MFVAVQVAGYPLLVWLVWIWLGIAERSVMEILGSAALGGAIVAALAWLLASAFDGTLKVRGLWVRSLVFVIAALVIAGAGWWLTRKIYPIALIALLVPPLYRCSWRVLGKWRYWAAFVLLAGTGLYLPWKMATWVPAATSLASQTASMAARFLIAYLLAVGSLVGFAAELRRLANPTEPTRAA
jgi:hypothetical protein